ncbi:TFIIH subunit Tfb4/p34 [Xylariaceae sp. FL0594]|nr:TFIIH subunit Tfb4/p34 [Xylariaceae sp. FL0594]
MNRIDASEHYDESGFTSQTPSLLTVVIDTNPRAWAAIHDQLPISKAIASVLVFINAHIAFGNENRVAVIAAHTNRAVWLYPSPSSSSCPAGRRRNDSDVEMTGVDQRRLGTSPNKYPQFAQIESAIVSSLRSLIESTTPSDLTPTTTLISGALSMALSYTHKTSLAFEPPKTSSDPANPTTAPSTQPTAPNLHGRILVLSVSQSEPSQYIATMNAVFAASHARIPIDTLALYSAPSFLQQAAFITGGIFMSAALNPRGLLSYLMSGLLADADARASLVTPTQDSVDFRAACFCHRRVVDTGFVCSICLSIFCEVPPSSSNNSNSNSDPDPDAPGPPECLTCCTRLALGNYGAKPAVVPRRKKKRKRINGDTASATGTPAPP